VVEAVVVADVEQDASVSDITIRMVSRIQVSPFFM